MVDVREIDDMDKECIDLCHAMNQFKGIHTTSSCCGHNKHGYWIFFTAETIEDLAPILYYFDVCHSGCSGWEIVGRTDCSMCRPSFLAKGPSGEQGVKDAKIIALALNRYRKES